jgi:hypothetical protein
MGSLIPSGLPLEKKQLVTWTSTSKALVFLICWLTKIAYFVLLTDLMVGD